MTMLKPGHSTPCCARSGQSEKERQFHISLKWSGDVAYFLAGAAVDREAVCKRAWIVHEENRRLPDKSERGLVFINSMASGEGIVIAPRFIHPAFRAVVIAAMPDQAAGELGELELMVRDGPDGRAPEAYRFALQAPADPQEMIIAAIFHRDHERRDQWSIVGVDETAAARPPFNELLDALTVIAPGYC